MASKEASENENRDKEINFGLVSSKCETISDIHQRNNTHGSEDVISAASDTKSTSGLQSQHADHHKVPSDSATPSGEELPSHKTHFDEVKSKENSSKGETVENFTKARKEDQNSETKEKVTMESVHDDATSKSTKNVTTFTENSGITTSLLSTSSQKPEQDITESSTSYLEENQGQVRPPQIINDGDSNAQFAVNYMILSKLSEQSDENAQLPSSEERQPFGSLNGKEQNAGNEICQEKGADEKGKDREKQGEISQQSGQNERRNEIGFDTFFSKANVSASKDRKDSSDKEKVNAAEIGSHGSVKVGTSDTASGKSENPEYVRSESEGFDLELEQKNTEKLETNNDNESVSSSSKSEESSKLNGKDEKISINGSSEQMEVDNAPSPYQESEFSETVGPQTPASVYSMGDSMSVPAYDTMGPPTPSSIVTDSVSMGPTPSKRSRSGINTNEAPITASTLIEYQWPQDESGDFYMLQEQISEFLHIKSFKRKYPDLFRRQVDIKERVFLMEKGTVTETQADLGLTALRSDEVYDLMMKDYPTKYQEYLHVVHERQKQKISEKHKEYEVPKLEKGKMTQYLKKAMKSAAEWNSHFQKERREERRAYLDLQTFNIHYPQGKYKKLPPEATKVGPYPVALIPGQFQDYHKKYSPAELKYFPLNTALFNPPKKMMTTLANPREPGEGETASEEDTNATGSESDSDESSSGSEDSSQKEEEATETGETKEAAPDSEICRICELGKSDDVKGQDDLVCCSECKKVGHPACLDLTGEMVAVVKTYPWQCMECKTCVECMDPYDEDKMMFCDLCDRGYHTFCVGLKNIPTGRWKCRSCRGPDTPKTPKSSSKARGRGRGRGRNKGGGSNDPGTPTGRSQATPTPPPSSGAPSPAPVAAE